MKGLLIAGIFAAGIGLVFFIERRMFGTRGPGGGLEMLLEILSHFL